MNYKKILRNSAGVVSEKLLCIFPPYLIPFSDKVLEQFYVYKLRKQQFQAVRYYCIKLSNKSYIPEKLRKVSSDYYCKASLDNKPVTAVLEKLAVPYQKKTVQSLKFLYKNDNVSAKNEFKKALMEIGISGLAEENLEKAFSRITDNFQETYEKNISHHTNIVSAPKIILSGMNWSGTGALFDYFREFHCVKALSQEQRLWKESDYSLVWAYNNLEKLDDNSLVQYLLRLFLIPLTGLTLPRNYQDVFGSKVGYVNIKKDKEGLYSSIIDEFLFKIMELKDRHQLNKNSFLKRSVELTDRILNFSSDNFKGFILPDNAVHLSDIGTFRFFSNAYLICVFRDPRSNYAARFHENVRFNRDPDAYIKYYKTTRESFALKKEELKDLSARIIEVQFEDFILSDEFRKKLSHKIGIDFSGWKKQKYFKPYISEKNVFNYKRFHDQKTMDLISDSLKEYCLPDNY